jgi:hypothetical protein
MKSISRLVPIFLLVSLTFGAFSQDKDVQVFHEVLKDQSIKILAKNNTSLPQSVNVEGKIKGMISSVPMPVLSLLPPMETKEITILTPEAGKSYSYNYKFTYIMGDVSATHNDDFVYRLPYKKGEKHLVGQTYYESPTHMDKNAVDFNMDEGNEICAIRDGVVLQIIDKFNKGCPDFSCAEFNNFVQVLHDDGSIGDYSHIMKNGSLVKPRQQIKAGQVIAKSGSTGWASGPHLHLEIYVMRFSGQESIKAVYQLDKNTVGIPQSNKIYEQELEDLP